MYDLLGRVWTELYPEKQTRNAEAELAAMDPAQQQDAVQHKQQVKGGQTRVFFKEDKDAKMLSLAILLNGHQEPCLNACFRAEKKTSRYVDACSRLPADPSNEEIDAAATAQRDAMEANLGIASGDKAEAVITRYSNMLLNYEDAGWHGIDVDVETRHGLGGAMAKGIAEFWWRLVFKFLFPKYLILQLAALRPGTAAFEEKLNELEAKFRECKKCFDPCFAQVWLRRLRCPLSRPRALRCLKAMAAAWPATSARAERTHLIGQEAARKRKRGAALRGKTLAQVTYARRATASWRKLRNHVYHQVLETLSARRQFTQSLASFCIARSQKRKPIRLHLLSGERCRGQHKEKFGGAYGQISNGWMASAGPKLGIWKLVMRKAIRMAADYHERASTSAEGQLVDYTLRYFSVPVFMAGQEGVLC